MKTNSAMIYLGLGLTAMTVVVTLVLLGPDNQLTVPQAGSPRPSVAATIYPLYDIAKNVGANVVEVELILPANAEPHTYEPTPNAMKAISAAKAVYAVGHNLDVWVLPLAAAGKVPTVIVDSDVALMSAEGDEDEPTDGFDPHYWLSTTNAKIIATNIARDLTARFPNQASVISANLTAYVSELERADTEVRRLLEPVTDRRLATFHGAFGYFAADYGLEIAAVFEPFPGQEPTPRYLAELGTKVKELKIKTIYHEPAFNAAAIRSFADENDLTLGELDDLGGAPGRDSLITTLIYDAQSIASHQ